MSVDVKDKGKYEVGVRRRVGLFWVPYSWLYFVQHRSELSTDWLLCSAAHILINLFLSSKLVHQFLGGDGGLMNTLRDSWALWPLYLMIYIRVRGNWFLRATQNHFIVSMLMRKVRQYWRRRVRSLIERTEGPGYIHLKATPPKASKDVMGDIRNSYEVVKGSSVWLQTLLVLMSSPLHAIPVAGPAIYFWLYSGLRAQRMCAVVTDSEKNWTKGFRAIWKRHHRSRVQLLACLLEVLELTPYIGEAITLLNDIATLLWAAEVKNRLRLHELTVDDVRATLNLNTPRIPAQST